MLLTFDDAGLRRVLSSSSSMTAMWGDAARQVQLLLAAVIGAPVFADLLRLACVQVRSQSIGAVFEHGPVRLHAVLLDEAGSVLPLQLPPTVPAATAARLRVAQVVLASDSGQL